MHWGTWFFLVSILMLSGPGRAGAIPDHFVKPSGKQKPECHMYAAVDLNAIAFPPCYLGPKPDVLAGLFIGAPVKDKFETTDTFNARLEQWKSKRLFADYSPRDTTSVVRKLGARDFEYDADRGLVTFNLYSLMSSTRFMPVSKKKRDLPSRRGATALGLVTSYIRYTQEETGVGFTDSSVDVFAKLAFVAPVESVRAKSLAVALIGVAVEPYTYSEHEYHAPTIDEPWETIQDRRGWLMDLKQAWLFDVTSGEILWRLAPCSKQSGIERSWCDVLPSSPRQSDPNGVR